MSATLALALVIQLASVVVVVLATKPSRLRYIGLLFIVMAFIYHGVTEVYQLVFGPNHLYRAFVDQEPIDSWALLVSTGMLCFAVVYALSLSRTSPPTHVPKAPADWRFVLALVVPLFLGALYSTVVLNAGIEAEVNQGADTWLPTLASQFLLLLTVLLSYCFIVKSQEPRVGWIVAAQSLVLILLGERLQVLAGIVVLLYALARVGVRIKPRIIAIGLVLSFVTFLAISSARLVVGRERFGGSPGERIQILVDSITSIQPDERLTEDFAHRFDGNTFAALVKMRLADGWAPLGMRGIAINLGLTIPQVLNPTKLESSVADRDEEAAAISQLRLPLRDYLPTLFGTVFSYGGAWLIAPFGALLGFLVARLDSFLQKRDNVLVLLVCMGASYCVFFYERTSAIYYSTARAILILLVLLKVGGWLRARNSLDHAS